MLEEDDQVAKIASMRDESKNDIYVLKLDDKTFSETTANAALMMVLFYLPCMYCNTAVMMVLFYLPCMYCNTALMMVIFYLPCMYCI